MNRREPTTEETKALERIEALRARTPLLGSLLAVVPIAATQLLPERHASIAIGVSIAAIIGAIAMLVYRACLLRCPRCSGWVAIPKCPSCGLALEQQSGKHRRTANS